MERDVAGRLEDWELAGLWTHLNRVLQREESFCDEPWSDSRRAEFFRIVAKAVGFDPEDRPEGAYDE